jgi:acyl carrier protein
LQKSHRLHHLAKDELRALSGCKTILRGFVATLARFVNGVTIRGGFDGSVVREAQRAGGLSVTSSALIRPTSAEEEGSVTSDVRALIAEHLEIDIESVTADTHFTDDLGFDQLDILELIIMIEDQFVEVEVSDEADQIEFVGDLIRQIEMVGAQGSKRRGLRPMPLI